MSSSPEMAGSPVHARVNWRSLAWRWHACDVLLALPFLLTLALTGAVMVCFTGFQTRLGVNPSVEPLAATQSLGARARAALSVVPDGQLRAYIAPRHSDLAAWFVIERGDESLALAVDPYRATVLRNVDKTDTL